MTLSFNQLRQIKDSLPDGSMKQIASELGLNADTVRNYFGGEHYKRGESMGYHIEPGPDGGLVHLDNPLILERAKEILRQHSTI